MSPTQQVVIIGAGDHGRGALEIFREANRVQPRFTLLGFLDDAVAKHGTTLGDLTVLGGVDWIDANHQSDLRYVIGIADTRVKQRIADQLARRSLTFASAIHPAAFLATGVRVGPGALINAGVAIAYDTVVDEHTTVNLNATVGHDCVLGRFSTVAPGANIAGKVHVGEGCDVGLNATVGKGLVLGDWCSVGPGAVVIKNVDGGQRVFGNPARVVPAVSAALHSTTR